MSEQLITGGDSKAGRYAILLPQLEALIEAESDAIAVMANVAAAIMGTFDFLWVGFYRVVGEQLVLGPFQGPLACTRIARGRGVCGTAWVEDRTVVVPDVELFPGHIACSSASRSEIVVPYHDALGRVAGVLDIDSAMTSTFDDTDADWLGRAMASLTARLGKSLS